MTINKNIKSTNSSVEHIYYDTSDVTLYLGDCIDIMKSLPSASINMIFADPPYMLSNNGFSCQNGKRVSVNKGKWDQSSGFDSDLEFHHNWIGEAHRILDENGTIWISGTYHNIYQCGVALQKLGFSILNEIVWFKPNASPNLSCRMFTASHETILWAKKSKKSKHYFNYNAMKNGDFKEDKLKKENMQMRSVWQIPSTPPKEKKNGKHPTQKPLDLLKRIILASTKENDLILDPFNGSGTTAVASKFFPSRKYLGIDTEENYLNLTIVRLKNDVNLSSNQLSKEESLDMNLLQKKRRKPTEDKKLEMLFTEM